MKNDSSWNEVSAWYDKHVGDKGSDYHQKVLIPGTLRLLRPLRAEKALDIGCGQGVFCRELAKQGVEAYGVDSSPNLIKAAQSRSKNIKYFVSRADLMKMFEDETFDAITSIMSIQNMEPLSAIMRELSRVIKYNGRMVIATSHPCFRIPRQSSWGIDEKKKIQFRRVDSYLSEQKISIKMHPGFDPQQVTWTFHRPLQEYFKAFAKNNFAVVNLEEWITHRRTNEKRENRARDEFPMFIAFCLVKV